MLVQALPPHSSPLLQLPYITPEIISHCSKGKKNINTIEKLIDLPEEIRRNTLLKSLTDREYSCVLNVANKIARLECKEARFRGKTVKILFLLPLETTPSLNPFYDPFILFHEP